MFIAVLLFSFIFLLILFQNTEITCRKGETVTLQIDFIFWGLFFNQSSNDKKKDKSRGGKIKNISCALKALNYVLPKADVRVYENIFNENENRTAQFSFSNLSLFITVYSIFPIIKSKAKNFSFYTQKTDTSDELTIYLSAKLIYLIISLLIFQYYKLRNIAKKGASYGR